MDVDPFRVGAFSVSYDLNAAMVKKSRRAIYTKVVEVLRSHGFTTKTLKNVYTKKDVEQFIAFQNYTAFREEIKAKGLERFFRGIAFFERLRYSKAV